MKHCENANVMQCMNICDHWSKAHPKNFAKASFTLKNPKIFKKPQNLDLYEGNAWKRVKTRSYQRWEDQSRLKNHWVRGLERKKSVWEGKRHKSIERDRRKWSLKSR